MALTPQQQELADIDTELARRGQAPQSDELTQIDAELKRRKNAGALPANSGISKFAASVAGLPVDTIENAINLGVAGYGRAKGALTGRGGDSPEPMQGSFGGSHSIEGGLRALSEKTGIRGLNPDNPAAPGDELGNLQYNLAARGGGVPGSFIPAVGSIIAEKIGGPQWAGVGSLAPSAAVSAYNQMRAPQLAAEQAKRQVRDQTLKEAREEGYVTPPSQSNPSFVGNRLESVAGKAAVKQEATIRNQDVTDKIARREAGLRPDEPITEKNLSARRDVLSEPYRQVAGLSSRAQVALEQLKQARHDANNYWQHYDRSADPNSLAAAKNFDQKAGAYERVLEQEASRAGKPQLIQELRGARQNIAKTYDIERAINVGDGTVDARVLGRAMDKGKRLTGGLETVAKFAQGPGAQVSRPSGLTPAPGVSALEPAAATIFGLQGGAAAAGLPLARGPVRHMLLSDWYQNTFGQPTYTPSMLPEGQLQALIRSAATADQNK